MNSLYATYALYGLGAVVLGAALAKLRSRLQLSKAKHRSLAGHSRMSRR
jgi:glutamate-1-semialdehyde 2,1-aminomutase